MRDQIISEIRRLAVENGGNPPGQIMFARQTGIATHTWLGKTWARWGDALTEAGFRPNSKTERLSSESILDGLISACRFFGKFPSKAELELYAQSHPVIPSSNALRRHFGSRAGMAKALKEYVDGFDTFADVAVVLPQVTLSIDRDVQRGAPADGFVYLIKSGVFYKIGRSDDIERRIKEIRIALPDKADMLHVIRTDDPSGIEAYWHARFREKRANGEWFKLTAQDVAIFKKRKFQ